MEAIRNDYWLEAILVVLEEHTTTSTIGLYECMTIVWLWLLYLLI
jgi:hypothetical protein